MQSHAKIHSVSPGLPGIPYEPSRNRCRPTLSTRDLRWEREKCSADYLGQFWILLQPAPTENVMLGHTGSLWQSFRIRAFLDLHARAVLRTELALAFMIVERSCAYSAKTESGSTQHKALVQNLGTIGLYKLDQRNNTTPHSRKAMEAECLKI